jgi:monoamine oxidase
MTNGGVMATIEGVRVVVVGAGLSGLTAAADLARRGARVEVIEARERIGGRVWTIHDDASPVYAEAGAEFIDVGQREIRALCRSFGIALVPVLRGGFGLALDLDGRVRVRRSMASAWRAFARHLRPALKAYRQGGEDDGSVAAGVIAARSFARSVAGATTETRAMAQAMRGLYLADAEDLSALVIVQQIAGESTMPRMSRIRGGAHRLIAKLAAPLRGHLATGTVVRGLRQTPSGVRVDIEDARGRHVERRADYVVMTAPPPLVVDCAFDPPLPEPQRAALTSLPMGPATKLSLRFAQPWWRAARRPRAFGSNLPTGAVWDAAEGQSDAAVLACLAGGSSSAALRAIVDALGADGVAERLRWLGTPLPATLVGPVVSWDRDPWARGGYAVFPPTFDPRLRRWLGARHGRVTFAGEHTSERWQGFMNGAVESGQRAAAEIVALHDLVDAGWTP